MDNHPCKTHSCRRGDRSSLASKSHPPQQILLHSAKLPLDCRHRGRKLGELRGGAKKS